MTRLVADQSAAQEILSLKRRIEELETQISENERTAPSGSEVLAQGDETIVVHFSYQDDRMRYLDGEDSFSWNGIVSTLGPILLNPASEDQLKIKLGEAFANRHRDKNRATIYDADPRDEDFQKIKIQLRALGLIREFRSQSDEGKHNKQWVLTFQGDQLMTQVAAIRSSARD